MKGPDVLPKMSSVLRKIPGLYKLCISCLHYALYTNVICLRVSTHQNKHHSTLFDGIVHFSYKLLVHFCLKIKMEQVGNHQCPTKVTIAFSPSND